MNQDPEDVNLTDHKPTPQNNPNFPAIDTSELFSKDPESINTTPKNNLLMRFSDKKIIVIAFVLSMLLAAFAAVVIFNKSKDHSATQQSTEDFARNSELSNVNENGSKNVSDKTGTSDKNKASDGSTSTTTGAIGSSNTNTAVNKSSQAETGGSSSGGNTGTSNPTTHGINYTNSCYSPANITINKGDTVKFTNNSNKGMWPASDDHPSHTIYSEFDSNRVVNSGEAYSFTFTKSGSWGYHDHVKPGCKGKISVQ